MPSPPGPYNLTVVFTDVNSSPIDPASGITIKVKAPNGTLSTYTYPSTATKLATGTYQATAPLTQGGTHWAVGYGTLSNGMVVTSDDASQAITPSRVL